MARDTHTKATLARTRLIGQLRASYQAGAAAFAAVSIIMIATRQGGA